MTFALYGKCAATDIRELGDETLINDRANEAYVSATFNKDGNTYTVERTIGRKGSAKARLTSVILSDPIADVKAVNSKVKSVLGMDYETFVSSTIIRQEEMDRLTAKPPAERKAILASIFGLQDYESMREHAHEKAWEIRNQISSLEATKKMLENKISHEEHIKERLNEHNAKIIRSEENFARITTRKIEIERELDEITQRKIESDTKEIERMTLANQLEIDEQNSKNILRQIQEVENATTELETLKLHLKERVKLSNELRRIIQQREQLKVTETEWLHKIQTIELKVKEETENYRRIKDHTVPECPICKRPLDEPHRKQLLKKYEYSLSELLTERDQAAENVRNVHSVLKDEVGPATVRVEKAIDELSELDRRIGQLTTLANRLPQLEKELKRINEQTTQTKKRIAELESVLRKLAPTIKSFKAFDEERRKLESELTEIQIGLGTAKADRNRDKEDLSEIEQAKTKHREIIEQMGEQERIRWAYEFLEKEVFHKDGVPTAILMEIVPEIEQEASKILRDLSNGRMDVSFRFGRKTKTGKVTEELIIEAVEQSRSHPVSRYSGGERIRINLALRLGVSEVVTQRSGYRGRIETLVIDEGFGPLDEEGRRAAVEILQTLRTRFKKILVISHIEDVREAFETNLTVTKPVGGYSSINLL